MHQLTAHQAAMLSTETASNLGHTSFYVVLDRDRLDATAITVDDLRTALDARISLVPGFRRRVWRVPMSLDRPWWIEDPRFDLDYHLRHLAVPNAGSGSDVASLIARLHERPLDRRHPLWEMYLIDQPDGHQGIFTKVHFALLEGVTGLDVLTPLASDEPVEPAIPWQPDLPPSNTDLLIRAGWSTARSPLRWIDLVLSTTRLLPGLNRQALPALQARWASPNGTIDIHDAEVTPPRVSFNRTIGLHRRVAFETLPLDEVRAVRKRFDVRFNDVIAALVSGALRHWLVLHDELPPEPLIALSPILVDSLDEPLGTALMNLATHRHSPVDRLMEIAEWSVRVVDAMEAEPVDAIRQFEAAAPALASMASRLVVRTGAATRFHPPFNVYLVSVPGGDNSERRILGSGIKHQFPLATIVDGTGLSISVMSSKDCVDVTFVADRDLIPDLDMMSAQLHEELKLLLKAKVKRAA